MKGKKYRINNEITAKKIRLMDINNKQLGIIDLINAFEIAKVNNTDLIEIAPNANPPVVKLINYGKFKYKEKKKEHKIKLKRKIIQIKEIKFRPNTHESDINIKLKKLKKFLNEGNKVKITLTFKGREIFYQNLGMKIIEKIKNNINLISHIEKQPEKYGKQIIMIIAPLNKK